MKKIELQLNKSEREFLVASRKYRVRNILLRTGFIFAIISITTTAAIVSFSFFKDSQESLKIAKEQTQRAEDSSKVAIRERQNALDSAKSAIASRQLALMKAQEAEDSAEVAIIQREIAQMEQKRAQDSAIVAQEQRKIALLEQKRAEDSARVAQEQRQEAQKQTKRALEETRQANLLAASALASNSRATDIFNRFLKAFLARQAFKIHQENGGSAFDTTMYQALYSAQVGLEGQNYNHLYQGRGGNGIVKVLTDKVKQRVYFLTLDGMLGIQPINGKNKSSFYPFGKGTRLTAIALSSNSKWLAIGGNQEVRVYDLTMGNFQAYKAFRNHTSYVNDIHFIPNREEFISVGKDKKVVLQRISQSSPTYNKTLKQELVSFGASENGAYLMGITKQGTIIRISELTKTPKEEKISLPRRAKFSCIAFSPNKKKWAAGASNGKVFLWNAFQPGKAQSLTRHGAPVNSIQFSSNGAFLASCSNDQTIHLWNLAQPKDIPLILRDHPAHVRDLDFDKNTSTLIVGCWKWVW